MTGTFAVARAVDLDLVALAEELAIGLRPPVDVWHSYGIHTKETAGAVLRLPAFQEMLAEATARWQSKSSLRERVKAKSLVAIEQFLPDLVDEGLNTDRALNHRMLVWKQISAWAGIDAEAAASSGEGGAGGVSITIDLSGPDGSGQVITVNGAAGGKQDGSGSVHKGGILDQVVDYGEGEEEGGEEGGKDVAVYDFPVDDSLFDLGDLGDGWEGPDMGVSDLPIIEDDGSGGS